jgi:hypothetical protein
MQTVRTLALAALWVGVPLLGMQVAHAASPNEIKCEMRFEMHGWSVFYKTAEGSANVSCTNGQRMSVHLRSKGGGLTFGKQAIEGVGKFSGIYNINEILGTYVTGGAHAGAVNAAGGTVMTKGNVALALSGTGKGWNIGVDFGKFIISR